MAYITLEDFRIYRGLSADETGDDELIEDRFIPAAQAEIEQFCHRIFEATTQTRAYDQASAQRVGQRLYLDQDLISVTSLTNGTGEVIPANGYRLQPRNDGPPYSSIQLLTGYVWMFNTDGEIEVEGTWGWSATPPADVVQATLELTNYLYTLKNSQIFDVTAMPESGVIQVPKGWPQHVKVSLSRYVDRSGKR